MTGCKATVIFVCHEDTEFRRFCEKEAQPNQSLRDWRRPSHSKGRINPSLGLVCRHPGDRHPFHGRPEPYLWDGYEKRIEVFSLSLWLSGNSRLKDYRLL